MKSTSAFASLAVAVGLALLLCTESDIVAQSRGKVPPSPRPPIYATTALDTTAESLPPQYAGMDPLRVITVLKTLKTAKDEFETTDAYNNRMSLLTKSPLYGSLAMNDTLAFKARDEDIGDITFDADRGQIAAEGVRNGWHGGKLYQGALLEFLTLRVLQNSVSSSTMSNAFGAKVKVEIIRNRVAAIVFPFVCRKAPGPGKLGEASWSASVAEAQAFKSDHGILLVGSLSSPYFSNERNLHPPEFSQPWDQDDVVEGIRFEVNEIWYYIPLTGRVVHKEKASHRRPCF